LQSVFTSYERPEVLSWLIEELKLSNQYSIDYNEQTYRDYMAAAQKRRSLMTREERAAEDAFAIICLPIFKSIILSNDQDAIDIDLIDIGEFMALDYQREASLRFNVMSLIGLLRHNSPWEADYASMNKTFSQITLDLMNISNKEIDQRIQKISRSNDFMEATIIAQSLLTVELKQHEAAIVQYDAAQGIELVIKSHAIASVEGQSNNYLIYTDSNTAYFYNPFAEINSGLEMNITFNFGEASIIGKNINTAKMTTRSNMLMNLLEQPNNYAFYFKLPASTDVYIDGKPAESKTLLDLSLSNKAYESKQFSSIEFVYGDQTLSFDSWMGYRIYTDHGHVVIEKSESGQKTSITHQHITHSSSNKVFARFKQLLRHNPKP
jgi:hypothetical protein